MNNQNPNSEESYIEIDFKNLKSRQVYRFYGQGIWKIQSPDNGKWFPINSIFIPADVLAVAAKEVTNAKS